MEIDKNKFRNVKQVGNKWYGDLKLSEANISKDNIRPSFTPKEIEVIKGALAPSIKAIGLQQLPVSTPKGEIFIGGRRLKAYEFNNEKWIPAEIRLNTTSYERQKASWAENRARTIPEPLQEARQFAKMIKERNLSHRALAKELNITRDLIDDRIKLLKVFSGVGHAILEGTGTSLDKKRLTTQKARKLSRDWIPQEVREEIVEQIETEGMTDKEVQQRLGKGKIVQTIIEQTADEEIKKELEKEFGGTEAFKEDMKAEDVLEKKRILEGLSPELNKKQYPIEQFLEGKETIDTNVPNTVLQRITTYARERKGNYLGLKSYIELEISLVEDRKIAKKEKEESTSS